jgi:hypothetical protein
MSIFSKENSPSIPLEIVDLISGKTHIIDRDHYLYDILPRLNSLRRISELRKLGTGETAKGQIEQPKHRAEILKYFKAKLNHTTASPAAHTSQ